MKSFEIDFQLLRESLSYEELILLIGVDWYIVGEITDDIIFKWSSGHLEISYIIHENEYKYNKNEAALHMIKETSENEMPDFSRRCFQDTESVLVKLFYKHIDKVVGFLHKEVII